MEYTIRIEQPKDYFEVENLTREAFWRAPTPDEQNLRQQPQMPNCSEHLLVHQMRTSPYFVPQLAFVAVRQAGGAEEIVGNIMYAESRLATPGGEEKTLLTFGPLSVLPACQNQGIGGALIRHSIKEAQRLGYAGVVIYGHPGYYPRFGFENAQKYGITTEDGKNFDAFMALGLYPGALAGPGGRLLLAPVYNVDPAALPAFDAQFPKKEK